MEAGGAGGVDSVPPMPTIAEAEEEIRPEEPPKDPVPGQGGAEEKEDITFLRRREYIVTLMSSDVAREAAGVARESIRKVIAAFGDKGKHLLQSPALVNSTRNKDKSKQSKFVCDGLARFVSDELVKGQGGWSDEVMKELDKSVYLS